MATFNGTVLTGALNQSSGTLAGAGAVTFAGASTWTGGTMSGAGQTTIDAGGMLAINTPGTNVFLQRLLENNGAATWTGNNAGIDFVGGTWTNNGSFTANSNNTLHATGSGGTNVFDNNGTFTKLGTGTTRFYQFTSTGVTFNNSGTVNVQSGTLSLESGGIHTGDFSIATGATLRFGGDHDIVGGETLVEFGGILESTAGPLYVGAISETEFATLTNFGIVTSDVIVEGAFLRGAGVIEGSLTLHGATAQNTQREAGLSENIEVLGDLIIEPPGFGLSVPAGSILLGDTITVQGAMSVRAPFVLQNSVLATSSTVGQVIIEDGGTVVLDNARIGSTERNVDVRVDPGGVLEGIGDAENPIRGSVDYNGGEVKGKISAKNV
jgi:hypothetical protein